MVPAELGSLEFLQFFVTQAATIWGIIGFIQQARSRLPSRDEDRWRDIETGRYISAETAVWSIATLVGTLIITVIVDWPVIAEWVPWEQIGVTQSNVLLEAAVWLYNLLFSALSSISRTGVAILSVVAASILNLFR